MDKEKGRKILEEIKQLRKKQDKLKFDFLGIRFLNIESKIESLRSELHTICFG